MKKSKNQKKHHFSRMKYLIVDGKCYELDINERLIVKFPKMACRDMKAMLDEVSSTKKDPQCNKKKLKCNLQKNTQLEQKEKSILSSNTNITFKKDTLDYDQTFTDSLVIDKDNDFFSNEDSTNFLFENNNNNYDNTNLNQEIFDCIANENVLFL